MTGRAIEGRISGDSPKSRGPSAGGIGEGATPLAVKAYAALADGNLELGNALAAAAAARDGAGRSSRVRSSAGLEEVESEGGTTDEAPWTPMSAGGAAQAVGGGGGQQGGSAELGVQTKESAAFLQQDQQQESYLLQPLLLQQHLTSIGGSLVADGSLRLAAAVPSLGGSRGSSPLANTAAAGDVAPTAPLLRWDSGTPPGTPPPLWKWGSGATAAAAGMVVCPGLQTRQEAALVQLQQHSQGAWLLFYGLGLLAALPSFASWCQLPGERGRSEWLVYTRFDIPYW